MRYATGITFLAMAASTVAFAQGPASQPGARRQLSETPSTQAPLIGGIPNANQTNSGSTNASSVVTEQMEGELLSSDLIGRPLHDAAGTRVGTVRDILISRDHKMTALVADLDAASGADGRRVGIPIGAIEQKTVNRRDVHLLVKMDPSTLKNAKAFEPLAREAGLDDNQDLTKGSGTATGGSVPQSR
jgi:PRC-barrel domain